MCPHHSRPAPLKTPLPSQNPSSLSGPLSLRTPSLFHALSSPCLILQPFHRSGQSATTGTDTPDSLAGVGPSTTLPPQQLYQVLEQRDARVGGATFGSSHTYVVPKAGGKAAAAQKGGVEVALDPSELERLDEGALKAKYNELRQAEQEANAPEDVSDIIEEQERKRRRKLEGQKGGDKKQGGSFKF